VNDNDAYFAQCKYKGTFIISKQFTNQQLLHNACSIEHRKCVFSVFISIMNMKILVFALESFAFIVIISLILFWRVLHVFSLCSHNYPLLIISLIFNILLLEMNKNILLCLFNKFIILIIYKLLSFLADLTLFSF